MVMHIRDVHYGHIVCDVFQSVAALNRTTIKYVRHGSKPVKSVWFVRYEFCDIEENELSGRERL